MNDVLSINSQLYELYDLICFNFINAIVCSNQKINEKMYVFLVCIKSYTKLKSNIKTLIFHSLHIFANLSLLERYK